MPPNDKHPQNVVVDATPPGNRRSFSNGNSFTQNAAPNFSQEDIYISPASGGSLASLDLVARKTDIIQNIYFDVDSWNLKTADSRASKPSDAQRNDAEATLSSEAKQIAAALHQNKDMDIIIVGHASKTSTAAHNQDLSDNRAQAVAHYLQDAVTAIDPSLASRFHVLSQGKGDTDLSVQTNNENTQNRNVSIMTMTNEPTDIGRQYRMVHLSPETIQDLQAGSNRYQIDFGMQSSEGQGLKQKFSTGMTVPARGSLLLETADLKKPLDIDISAKEANDFRLLVNDPHADLRYQIAGNDVIVTDHNKAIANLHYQTGDHKPLTVNDVQVASVNLNDKHPGPNGLSTTPTIPAQGQAMTPSQLAYYNLAKRMDTDGNGIVSPTEMRAYMAPMDVLNGELSQVPNATRAIIGGGKLEVTNGRQYSEGPAPAALQRNPEDVIKYIGGEPGGNGSVSLDGQEIAAFRGQYNSLRTLSSAGILSQPGGLSLTDFAIKADSVLTGATSATTSGGTPSTTQTDKPKTAGPKPF